MFSYIRTLVYESLRLKAMEMLSKVMNSTTEIHELAVLLANSRLNFQDTVAEQDLSERMNEFVFRLKMDLIGTGGLLQGVRQGDIRDLRSLVRMMILAHDQLHDNKATALNLVSLLKYKVQEDPQINVPNGATQWVN